MHVSWIERSVDVCCGSNFSLVCKFLDQFHFYFPFTAVTYIVDNDNESETKKNNN